jgi:hypothetical protein
MNIVSEGRVRRSGSNRVSDGVAVAVGVGEAIAVGVGVPVGIGEGVALGEGVAVGEDVAVGRAVAVGSAGETVGVTSPGLDVQPSNVRPVTNNTNRRGFTTQSCITTASYTCPRPPWLLRIRRRRAGGGGGCVMLTDHQAK